MASGDIFGLLAVIAFGVLVFWYGLRQQRRASLPLRARSENVLALVLGPSVPDGAEPPPGRWHRVLKESHSSATLRSYGPVVLFSEWIVVDQDGRHFHAKMQCDEKDGPSEPVLTPLASETQVFTFTASWRP